MKLTIEHNGVTAFVESDVLTPGDILPKLKIAISLLERFRDEHNAAILAPKMRRFVCSYFHGGEPREIEAKDAFNAAEQYAVVLRPEAGEVKHTDRDSERLERDGNDFLHRVKAATGQTWCVRVKEVR